MTPNQATLDLTIGAHHRNAGPTERAGAEFARHFSAKQKQAIHDCLLAHPEGLTDRQIAELTGIERNMVNPRRGLLVTEGKVYDSGEKRIYGSRVPNAVWKAR